MGLSEGMAQEERQISDKAKSTLDLVDCVDRVISSQKCTKNQETAVQWLQSKSSTCSRSII